MSHYLLSMCYPAGAVKPEPAELEQIMSRVLALRADLKSAGAWVFGGGLHDPSSATVLTPRSSGLDLIDGPFLETKEIIGGITVIAVADLDAALSWGGRLAEATGVPVEVRPFVDGAS
jgi:hypothetical protein